ncbi:PREDICTED: protein LBH-like [Cyprinodon variegatus]|uniref:Complement C5a receptor 1 n=1 Tax=Cyprinodon variegatus TaxID=28743 RepID=A0A3Q2D292_CYPVA|nr:PREDICTED: protein LBH-like [Cyprinodon variegatus]
MHLTTKERDMEEMSDQDPNCDDMQKKEQRLPFQIFPDPVEIVLGPEASLNSPDRGKERLPSIVVEPTEVSEVESGELRWPPENIEIEDDEEDLFLEQCIPPANIADWGEEDEEEEEETSLILQQQPGLTLLDLQSDAFRDDTPTLPPNSAPAFN